MEVIHMVFILCFYYVIVQGSIKKGIGVSPRAFLCNDLKTLNNVAWWYDWSSNLDVIRNYSGCANVDDHVLKHVPMTWGYGSYFSRYYLHKRSKFLLGFNEPNHQKQSNILAEDAAVYWKEVEALAEGRPLVSPAAARCGTNCNGDTKEWFDQFFKSCNGCRVDYLATHVYSCNAVKTMAFLEDLYKTYNLTIWLTEFACPYKTNPKRQLRFMKEILPLLEAAPYIVRYAWYVSRVTEEKATTFIPTSVSLFEPDSSNLTVLGEFYNNFTGSETISSSTTRTFKTITPTKPVNHSSTTMIKYNTTTVKYDTSSVTDDNKSTTIEYNNTITVANITTTKQITTTSSKNNSLPPDTDTTIPSIISGVQTTCLFACDITFILTLILVHHHVFKNY